MSVIPELGLERDTVNDHLEAILDEAYLDDCNYTGLWLTGEGLQGEPPETLELQPIISAYAMYYPLMGHERAGCLALVDPEKKYSNFMMSLGFATAGLEEDKRINGAIRQNHAESVKDVGGLLAVVSDRCEKMRVPLGVLVLYVKQEEDEAPSLATFHSISILPPEQALKAVKFAIWERIHE